MDRIIKNTIWVTLVVMLTALAFVVSRQLGSPYLTFTFNPFAVLSLLAIIMNLGLLYVINKPKHKAPETFWFSLFVIEIIYWGVIEFLQRSNPSAEGAMFWYSLSSPGWIFLGATFFLYTLTIVGRLDIVRNISGIAAIFGTGSLFLLLTQASSLIVNYDPAFAFTTPWGIYAPYGPIFPLFLIWLEVFFIASLVLMFRYYKQAQNPKVKQRAKYNFIAILIPLLGGSLSDGVFPVLGINVLPIAVLLTSAMAAVIGYAIVKYEIFTINPATVSSNILANMNEAVIILNRKNGIEYMNQRAVVLLGYTGTNYEKLKFEKLFHRSQDFQKINSQMLKSNRGVTKFQSHKLEITKAGGVNIPVLVSIASLADEGENVSGFALVITDLSLLEKVERENKDLENAKKAMLNALEDARELEEELIKEKASVERKVTQRTKQLFEEQAKLQASIDSLQVGFMIMGTNGSLVSSNAAALRILQLDAGNASMARVVEKLQPAVDLIEKVKECVRTQLLVDVKELSLDSKFLRLSISPIIASGRQVLGVVILIQDVTEEKVLQRSKDEFFSIASHELRTPLSAIRGNTSMIQSYFTEALDKNVDMKEMINDIHNSSVRLIEIVNDFLDATRLEQGGIELKYEDVDVSKLADLVAYEMNSIADEKKIYIKNSIGSQPLVRADSNRVKQVIYNLVGNAMKFTEKGGITLAASVEGEYLKVEIRDTGKGIPPDKQSLLFRKFQQAGSSLLTRDSAKGTGLGLYISKLLIEKMGGSINLKASAVGKGSVFFFALPLAGTATASAQENKPAVAIQ